MKMAKEYAVSLLLALSFSTGFSCTDFRIAAKDNSVIVARSMEFAVDLKSNLRSSPRGRVYQNISPNGKAALSWKSKYGYLYLDAFNADAAVDGMNEEGLSFEYLYLPGETQYQTVEAGHENQSLPYYKFGDWVLSNFKTIDEVRQALSQIQIFEQKAPGFGDIVFPLHAAIYDASGKGLVVEFIKGKMAIYDNLGVMTNSPSYPWHLTNLRNYLNMSPINPNPVKVEGITFASTGQGSGMIGLPGDISPPSRFVKIAIMLQTVIPAIDAVSAVNLAEHIINNVDIPLGFVREAQSTDHYTNEFTQWAVFKDLTNRIFYYRTYDDLNLHAVNLAKVDLSENAVPLKMPIAAKPQVQDMTEEFLSSKQ